MGVAKLANNYNDLVKGSLSRQKLQNSKVYAKSPEFSPALRASKQCNVIGSVRIHIYMCVQKKNLIVRIRDLIYSDVGM